MLRRRGARAFEHDHDVLSDSVRVSSEVRRDPVRRELRPT